MGSLRERFGEPIDVSEKLAAGGKRRQVMAELTDEFEKGVQLGLDEINLQNKCIGSEMY